jgi:transcriptional regulator with XRE-family HTH domain
MFGDRLRKLRGDRSQKVIATALGIPPTTLSTLENQRTVPRGEVVQKLAEYFKVPIDYFYGSSSPRTRISETAKAAALEWLDDIRQPAKGKNTIATQANVQLDEKTKERIAERLRERRAQTSNSD